MLKSKNPKRVGLDPESSKLVQEKIKDLKQGKEYLKVNESKLASKAIEIFFNKYYQKEKIFIEKSFFDQKAVLQEIINKSKNDDELLESMSSYLKKGKRKRRIKTTLNN